MQWASQRTLALVGLCLAVHLLALTCSPVSAQFPLNCSSSNLFSCPVSKTCKNYSGCLDEMVAKEQDCATTNYSFCPKQGNCDASAPGSWNYYTQCNYGLDLCGDFVNSSKSYCTAGYNLCVDQRQCEEATVKRFCPNNRTLLTTAAPTNTCYVPPTMIVRFTVLQQEGVPVLALGSNILDKGKLNIELTLNRSLDNNSCVSVDPQAMSTFTDVVANLSWVRLRMRYIDSRDGRQITVCEPTYGVIIPPRVRPTAQSPLVVLKRNGTNYLTENFYLPPLLRNSSTAANTALVERCNTIGIEMFPNYAENIFSRRLCRDSPSKALYCYLSAPPQSNAYFSAYFSDTPQMLVRVNDTSYLFLSYENLYLNFVSLQPGNINLTCRLWNGFLPLPGAQPTDQRFFGDEVLRIEYYINCSGDQELCPIAQTCIPKGTLCRAKVNCIGSDIDCAAANGCANISTCVDKLSVLEKQCSEKKQNFCPKQGSCYNSSAYVPYDTCDYGSDSCQYPYFGSSASTKVYCYAAYSLCLDQKQCEEAALKRSCPNNATLLTSLSSTNTCFVPPSLSIRITILQQEGPAVLRVGSIPLDQSRIGQEIQLNRSIDNNSCPSVDPQALAAYSGVIANLSWVRLRLRYVDRDGRVVAECQPSYGILLAPKTKPAAPFPFSQIQKGLMVNNYDGFYILDALRNSFNSSTAAPAQWCDSLGTAQFGSQGPNGLVRQQCRESTSKALYCYIDAPQPNFFGQAMYGQSVMAYGAGYLVLSIDGVYVNVFSTQPGRFNWTCKAWNGLLPLPGTPVSNSAYFGDDVFQAQYSVSCASGLTSCYSSCIPSGSSCRQPLNCTGGDIDCSVLKSCANVSTCIDKMMEMEQQCSQSGQVFCPKQGVCYNFTAFMYMPWTTCDYSGDACPANTLDSTAIKCNDAFSLCLPQKQCEIAAAKRACPNMAMMITPLMQTNSCMFPPDLDIRFSLVQQEGPAVLRFAAFMLEPGRIGQEFQVNRSTDNNSCPSVDPLAIAGYTGAVGNFSWVKVKLRLLKAGQVLSECQPSFGTLLPPKVRPATPYPTVVVQRSVSPGYMDSVGLMDIVGSSVNQSTVPLAQWCDNLGVTQIPSINPQVLQARNMCREVPRKAAFCYTEAPPNVTFFSIIVYAPESFYGRNVMQLGPGYLFNTIERAYINTYFSMPGALNFTCRSWNGLLPQPGVLRTDNNYFGDEILRIQFSSSYYQQPATGGYYPTLQPGNIPTGAGIYPTQQPGNIPTGAGIYPSQKPDSGINVNYPTQQVPTFGGGSQPPATEKPRECTKVVCPPGGQTVCRDACVQILLSIRDRCSSESKELCPATGICVPGAAAAAATCPGSLASLAKCEANETACPLAYGLCMDFATCANQCPKTARLLPASQMVVGFKETYRGAPDPGPCRTGVFLGVAARTDIRLLSVAPATMQFELDGRNFNSSAAASIGPDSCFRVGARNLQNLAINFSYSLSLADGSACVIRATVLLPPRAPPPTLQPINTTLSFYETSALEVAFSSIVNVVSTPFPERHVCVLSLGNITDPMGELTACAQRAADEAKAASMNGVYLGYAKLPVWPDIYGNLILRAADPSVFFSASEYLNGSLIVNPLQTRLRFEPNRNATTKSFAIICRGWSGLQSAVSYTTTGSLVRADLPSSALMDSVYIYINVLRLDQAPVFNKAFFTYGVQLNAEAEYASLLLQKRNFMLNQYGQSLVSSLRVSELTSSFYCDDDTAELGALVLQAVNDQSSGVFEYQLAGTSAWKLLNVSAEIQPFDHFRMITRLKSGASANDAFATIQCQGSLSSAATIPASAQGRQLADFLVDNRNGTPVNALFLPANATIRFRPTASASWSRGNSLLVFTAAEDLRPEQTVTFNPLLVSSATNASAAAGWLAVRPVTIGCDSQPWSGRQRDACNICGGNGLSCVDCSGTANGTAIRNDCGYCVGGTTGRDLRFPKDCAGRCNGTFKFENGVCYNSSQYASSVAYIESIWCDRVVNSTARINSCGYCTGGTTGRASNFGIGPCGCNSDTSCITGCDGVVESTLSLRRTRDRCGNCLLPSDRKRDICSVIQFTTGQSASWTTFASSQLLTISSSSINGTLVTAKLRLLRVSDRSLHREIPATRIDSVNGLFVYMAPAVGLVAGQYALQISYTLSIGATFDVDVSGRNLTIFGPPDLVALSPKNEFTLEEGAQTVIVIGRGFSATSDLVCLFYCDSLSRHQSCDPRTYFLALPAKFLNESAVECNISALSDVRQPLRWQLSVMCSQPQQISFDSYSVYRQNSRQLIIRSSVGPKIVLVTESPDGGSITLTFDQNIVMRSSGCTALLDSATLSRMGYAPYCSVVANTIVIRKGREATACSGSTISLRPNVVYVQGCDYDLATAASVTDIPISGGGRALPQVSLAGVSIDSNRMATVGSCDSFYLMAYVRNTIVLRLVWDIQCAGASCNSTALSILRSKFGSNVNFYSGADIPAGESYNITVSAQNECGTNSDKVYVVVQRRNERLPFTIEITGPTKGVSPDDKYAGMLSVYASPCYTSAISSLSFSWQITGGSRAVSVDLQSITGRVFRLPNGRLQGGQVYNLTACASLPSWPNAACSSISIETASRPLGLFYLLGGRSSCGATDSLTEYVYVLDPDYASDKVFCSFSLTTPNGGAVYLQDSYTGLLLSSFDFFKDSSATSDTIISVPWPNPSRYTLPSGTLYLSATCQRGTRKSSVTKQVQILARPPPSVRIQTEPTSKPQSHTQQLVVTAIVVAQEITLAQWSIDAQSTGLGVLPLENCTLGLPLITVCYPYSRCFLTLLVSPSPDCQFSPGAAYRFILTATASGGSAQAQYDFRVNAPPRGGGLTVSPTEGVSLKTLFVLTVFPNITDDVDTFFTYSLSCCRQDVPDQCVAVTTEATPSLLQTTNLPTGIWNCSGVAIDSSAAKSVPFYAPTVIQVTAEKLTMESMSKILSDPTAVPDGTAFGSMLINEPEVNMTDQEKQKKTEVVQGLATRDLSALDTNDPSGSCSRAASSCQLLLKTKSDTQYLTNLVLDTLTKCQTAFSSVSSGSGSTRSSRRRRDTSSSQGGTTVKSSPTEVKSVLDIASGNTHSTLDATTAANLQSSILNTVPGFCNYINPKAPAQTAAATMVAVRVSKPSFDSIGAMSLQMGCNETESTCLTSYPTRQQIMLGSDLQTRYFNWSCGVTDCFQDGACVATILLDKDVMTPQAKVASVTISTRRSPLTYVGIFHPSNGANQNVTQLSAGVAITANISGSLNTTSTSLICRRWNGADWTSNNCTTQAPYQSTNGNWFVNCICTDISSFVAVFEGPPGFQAETTTAPSTTPADSTTTTASTMSTSTAAQVTVPAIANSPNLLSVTLQIRITENYASVVTNETAFRVSVTRQLALQLRVLESQITNVMFANGSVIITFTVASQTGSNTTAAAALQQIVALMNSRSLVITGLDNTTLTMSWDSLQLLSTQSTATNADTSKSTNVVGIAVGASVGGVCLIVIVVVVIVMVKKTSRGRKVVDESNSDFRLTERGKESRAATAVPSRIASAGRASNRAPNATVADASAGALGGSHHTLLGSGNVRVSDSQNLARVEA